MGGVILTLLLAVPACQQHLDIPGGDSEPVDEIIFRTADPSLSAEVATKATAVTSLSSFNVSAVTGSAGSETAVWTNVSFSGNNDAGYKADKWWPAEDASYRFYASNSALTFAASGATVAATNATDVICAYAAAPSYKAKNTLSFEHIFARLGAVTVNAATGYTISNVSIKITPKTGGTYNLLTGAGHTDGTGWSGLATGSETVIASATGSNANDIYLVPGTYTLTASWTAARGLYTEDIQNMQVDVNLTAGKINTISTTLSGNAKEVVFSVNIAPWTEQNQVVEFPTTPPAFGGLLIAPGPLAYEGGQYVIKDSWNYSSYNTAYGKTEGSTYFNAVEIGQLFEKVDFSTSDFSSRELNNLLKPFGNWRLPTMIELSTITNGARAGSIVGSQTSVKYAWCIINGQMGLLLFPDNVTMAEKTPGNLTYNGYKVINGSPYTPTITLDDLNYYLNLGCVFLPAIGSWNADNNNKGIYCSSTMEKTYTSFIKGLQFTKSLINSINISPETAYFPVRLVREI